MAHEDTKFIIVFKPKGQFKIEIFAMSIEGEDGHQIITLKLYTPLLHLSSVKLRARRALSIFRDAPLRTRRVLPVQMFMAITPFWFSMEHL